LSQIAVYSNLGIDFIRFKVITSHNIQIIIIFEKSFTLNALPLDWRSRNITTIFKKGSELEPGNYRPVNLTCICCKIMESIIRQSITDHFINNNVFSNIQFGFVKGRSTVMQLL